MKRTQRERVTVPRPAITAQLRHLCDEDRVDGLEGPLQYLQEVELKPGDENSCVTVIDIVVPVGTTEWRCPACGWTALIDWEGLESESITRLQHETKRGIT